MSNRVENWEETRFRNAAGQHCGIYRCYTAHVCEIQLVNLEEHRLPILYLNRYDVNVKFGKRFAFTIQSRQHKTSLTYTLNS